MEEFSLVIGSGLNYREKPNSLIRAALSGSTFLRLIPISVLVGQASMLTRPVQFEDSAVLSLAESFFVKFYYSVM